MINKFSKVMIKFVPRTENDEPNELAQITPGLKIPKDMYVG